MAIDIGIESEAVAEQIGEREAALSEAGLGHLDRLAKLGRLTAGLVHELNQPAAFVMVSHAAMLRVIRELEHDLCQPTDASAARLHLAELARLANESLAAMEQLRRLAQNTRDFARIGSDNATPVDVNHVVTVACAITRHELASVSEVSMRLGCVPEILCDPLKLTQVLVNLLVNASDAVLERAGPPGRIRIATRATRTSVCIDVEDDGCGIPDAIRDRVFEPFFSTKPSRGTGLGLWLSAGIVKSLGGTLAFRSEVGQGTCFSVELPKAPGREH